MIRRNVAYIRVANKGDFAVELQKQFIDDYAKDHNFIIDYYYIDNGYSGTNCDRPQLRQLLRDVESKKVTNRIVIKDYSRMSRDVSGIYEIISQISKRNVELISIMESEMADINLFVPMVNMFSKNGLNMKNDLTYYTQQKAAVVFSPYEKGTIEDRNFRIEKKREYKQKGIDKVQFRYRKKKGIKNESR